MAHKKIRFRVMGLGIDQTVVAASPRLAKLWAAKQSGLSGMNVTKFMRAKGISVRKA